MLKKLHEFRYQLRGSIKDVESLEIDICKYLNIPESYSTQILTNTDAAYDFLEFLFKDPVSKLEHVVPEWYFEFFDSDGGLNSNGYTTKDGKFQYSLSRPQAIVEAAINGLIYIEEENHKNDIHLRAHTEL